MTNDLDLTKHSLTFPNLSEPQISRGNLIRWLFDRFSNERKVIIVQGPDGAGKTTLLAQFAKAYPDRCFSFFVGADLWSSSSRHFLLEMCAQMQLAVRSGGREQFHPI
jgi:ATP/maltotriose-dependent transcriptional regulator MalT